MASNEICTRGIRTLSILLILLTVGCRSPEPPLVTAVLPSPTPPPSGMPPTIQPTPVFTPTFIPPPDKELALCVGREEPLYPGYVYFNDWRTQKEFLNTITPPPIALGRDYQYTPTILEKLPSLADGDARLEPVTVKEGDLIVDNAGEVVSLEAGILYRPSGCRESACAETYAGGEVQMDRLSTDFRLLASVKWSDGTPLYAYDSTFAYEIITNPEFVNYCFSSECGLPEGVDRGVLERTADYLAIDERTVRWVGLPGYLSPRYFLNFLSPMPRHLLEDMPPNEIDTYTRGSRGTNFVGWGPYKVTEWISGEYLHMERNPHYYGAQDGLPQVDFLWWRYISDGEGNALKAMLEGNCSIASPTTTISETYLKNGLIPFQAVQDNDEIEIYITPRDWDGLVFNIAVPSGSFAFFEDAGVRQAVALGTDRAAIAQAIVGDSSLVRESYLPPQHYLYAGESLTSYPFSPERASQLLAESGWVDRDGDGILEKGGQPFVVKLITIPPESRLPGLEIFRQNMADLGIQVEIELQEGRTFYYETLPERTFDIYWGLRFSYAHWLDGLAPDCVSYTTGAIPTSDKLGQYEFYNHSGYSNPEFDVACQTGLTSLDPEEARESHILAQQIFSQDLPVMPLYSWPSVVLYRTEVIGLQVNYLGLLVNFELLDILDNR